MTRVRNERSDPCLRAARCRIGQLFRLGELLRRRSCVNWRRAARSAGVRRGPEPNLGSSSLTKRFGSAHLRWRRPPAEPSRYSVAGQFGIPDSFSAFTGLNGDANAAPAAPRSRRSKVQRQLFIRPLIGAETHRAPHAGRQAREWRRMRLPSFVRAAGKGQDNCRQTVASRGIFTVGIGRTKKSKTRRLKPFGLDQYRQAGTAVAETACRTVSLRRSVISMSGPRVWARNQPSG